LKSQKDKPKTLVSTADNIEEVEQKEGTSEEQTSSDEAVVSLAEMSALPEDAPAKRPFWSIGSAPSRTQILTAVAFWGVIVLAAILRFWGLGDRPLHHDESLHGYFALQLLQNNIENWASCFKASSSCYRYDPLLHGPFQFHAIAIVYLIAQRLGAPDHGINTTTVRIAAALLGTVIVGLPYFLRHHLGNIGAWLACFLLAVSPSMVYFSRFAREDIYMACFTLLLVVAVAQYVQTRRMFWLIMAAAAFALSYATKEATFLTIGVFGSFFGAIIAWEIGTRWSFPFRFRAKQLAANDNDGHQTKKWLGEHRIPRTAASVALILYAIVLGIFAKLLLGWVKNLSIYINANPSTANNFVDQLKTNTEHVIPWLGIGIAVVVMIVLLREQKDDGEGSSEERSGFARRSDSSMTMLEQHSSFIRIAISMRTFVAGLAALFANILGRKGPSKGRRVDPEKQPLLDTIVTMPWQHLFFGFVIAWTIFMVLFTALFTNIPGGIGDGIWQGLYYWIQQQQIARGGQPWYYYFMLIPLYEQIGVVFGLVGIVYSLLRPSYFRLFLVYWFVGNVFIYSWAGEKMPWLMIHMTMPLMLLAAIGLQLIVLTLLGAVKGWRTAHGARQATISSDDGSLSPLAPRPRASIGRIGVGSAIFGAILALFTLVLTLDNMIQVVYVHAADAPHEMMIYVQTTPDINIVMANVAQLDQKLYGGKKKLPIAVMNDATWPFAWYLRDYTNTCFGFPSTACPASENWPVIIAGGDNLPLVQEQYDQKYAYHQYEMRSQWDQGYMPPPCVSTPNNPCASQQYTGVGPLPWLSYGNYPPHPGQYSLALIAKNVWQWWWRRTPFGGIDGGYGMALLIRKNLEH
jgi:uncharacterized protein (TIGR03663 family)